MESGTQAMFEQLTLPIFQELTAGLSEPLAKISALPGEEQDLTEKEVALYEKFLESWKSSKKKINPHGLSTKTLKGMLSSNRGLDFLSIIVEMDRLGYDLEWQNIKLKMVRSAK